MLLGSALLSAKSVCWLGRLFRQRFLGIAFVAASIAFAGAACSGTAEEITVDRYRLSNGLEVLLHEDHTVPLVHVSVRYRVGGREDPPGKSGLAHLAEHMMFEGSLNVKPGEHFEIVGGAGGADANAFTGMDSTEYQQTVPSQELETVLWLESDRMGFLVPALNAERFAIQRDVVRNERRQGYENSAFAAEGFAIAEALYPAGHPARHRIIGSHEDLQSLTVEDVATFLSQWYGPANATLAISGDIAPGQTRALVNKWFADLPGSGQEPVRPVWPPPALNADVERTIEDPFTKVGRVHMAWPSPPITTTEDGAFDLLAFILADPRVGRLWNASPFDVFLDVSAYQLSREQGSEFHISIDGATQSVVSAAKRSILEVLQDIATRGVTPVDLARARESYETSLNQGLETLSGRTNWFQLLNRIATAPNDFAWLRRRWDLASPQVIRDLATQLLGSRRVTVVTLPKGGL